MEFPLAIADIYKSMSSKLHILWNFDRPMESVNLAANAQRIKQ